MSKLLPIIIFGMIMAFLSDRNSDYYRGRFGEKIYTRKEVVFFLLLTVAMAVFVGLRTRGNDTYAYRHMYEILPTGWSAVWSTDWSNLASAPGFQTINTIIKSVGFSVQDFLMLYAVFTVGTYLWFVRKYSGNLLFSVFLFFTMGIYTFTFAAIKQTVAVAFLLIATDRALKRKYVRFVFWIAVAMLFHPYAFLYLIIPFLNYKPWTRKTAFLLLATAVGALAFSFLLGPVLDIANALGADYTESEMTQGGVNIFRVFVVWVPVFLSFLVRDAIGKKNNRLTNIIVNAAMINAVIMFIGLFGTANYFARLANYFLIFQALALPVILEFFDPDDRRNLTLAAVAGYSAYFYYAEAIANGAFDNAYAFMSVLDYIRQLR